MTESTPRDDAIRAELLAWYRAEARDLPWRRTRDPYRIWLSEVMLQQTRVETVVPYYRRWLDAFPDVETLAEADEDRVLKQWEGLGYYRRARNLHRAAKQVVEGDGTLPTTSDAWLELAGVGRYTAGAVASIAFGEPVPVLDGNVKRVLARLDAVEESIDDSKVVARLWQRAGMLVEALGPHALGPHALGPHALGPRAVDPREADEPVGSDAGDFNQALMELGARICVPRRPRCLLCPLAEHCRARARGLVDVLPVRKAKRAVPRRAWAAAWIERRGKVLLARRPEGLLGGLWELPTTTVEDDEDVAAAIERAMVDDLALSGRAGEALATVGHAFTHLRVDIHLHAVTNLRGRARALRHAEIRWLPRSEIESLALPVAMRKLVKKALG